MKGSSAKRAPLCNSCASSKIAVQKAAQIAPAMHSVTSSLLPTLRASGYARASWQFRSRCWRAEARAIAPLSPAAARDCWSTPGSPATSCLRRLASVRRVHQRHRRHPHHPRAQRPRRRTARAGQAPEGSGVHDRAQRTTPTAGSLATAKAIASRWSDWRRFRQAARSRSATSR